MKTGATWGAIFDWDGVVIDSSELHRVSWDLLAEKEGRNLPLHYFPNCFGRKNEDIIPHILGWASEPGEIRRLGDRKEILYRQLIQERGIDPLPGVETWLKVLRDAGIPCAIGSSTERLNIDCVLDLTGLGIYFKAIVSADDVTRGKPDPQVFLLASEKIQVPPERCVVFEDAQVGIDAALAGGMKVVGVTTSHPADSLQGMDLTVQRLDQLQLNQLIELFHKRTRLL